MSRVAHEAQRRGAHALIGIVLLAALIVVAIWIRPKAEHRDWRCEQATSSSADLPCVDINY